MSASFGNLNESVVGYFVANEAKVEQLVIQKNQMKFQNEKKMALVCQKF